MEEGDPIRSYWMSQLLNCYFPPKYHILPTFQHHPPHSCAIYANAPPFLPPCSHFSVRPTGAILFILSQCPVPLTPALLTFQYLLSFPCSNPLLPPCLLSSINTYTEVIQSWIHHKQIHTLTNFLVQIRQCEHSLENSLRRRSHENWSAKIFQFWKTCQKSIIHEMGFPKLPIKI